MKRGVLRQIAALEALSLSALRERWKELYERDDVPRYSRSHLLRKLSYRLQELAFGGVSESTMAKLREHVADDGVKLKPLKEEKPKNGMPVIGTRIVREWRSERHEVTIVQGGVEYRGRRYRSLSAVAREITATRWNGPLFFGLRKRRV